MFCMDALNRVVPNTISQGSEFSPQPSSTVFPVLRESDAAGIQVTGTIGERNVKKVCGVGELEILGQLFPIVTLPENTPLLFQWFSLNKDSKIPDTYYANLQQACELESGRKVGLLISGHRISAYDKNKFLDLIKKFQNFRLIDFDLIDTEEYNYELSGCSIDEFYDKNPLYTELSYNHLYKKLLEGFSDFRVLSVLEQHKFYEYFDAARLFSMMMGGQLFESRDDSPSGCIYLDLDMAIKSQLGRVRTIDGFSCYFKDSGAVLVENSLFAVDRPRHPVLMKTLEVMKKDCTKTPAPRVFRSPEFKS